MDGAGRTWGELGALGASLERAGRDCLCAGEPNEGSLSNATLLVHVLVYPCADLGAQTLWPCCWEHWVAAIPICHKAPAVHTLLIGAWCLSWFSLT